MKRPAPLLVLLLLLGLPLLGVWLGGKPVSAYLEFPPRTAYVQHEPFSWPVFLALVLLIVLSVGPILLRVIVSTCCASIFSSQRPASTTQDSALSSTTLRAQSQAKSSTQHRFLPWWGWFALAWTGLWWMLAWTRFPWMTALQEHTFTPLWLGYIVVVNAWTFARTGYCIMLHRPSYFLSLFPLSAAFWWVFEYLNRFVQNWYYIGAAELSPLEYFLRATIPFSTVLPAVISTAELLTSSHDVSAGLEQFKPVQVERVKLTSWSFLILSCVGLFGIGLFPNYLFPLVWVGPLLLILSLQALAGQGIILSPLADGDWRGIWVPALAALICGWFWELWNWKSLAHWQYALPFVHRFQLFEMPLLGYAGYLPFGLECVVVANLCLSRQYSGGMDYYSR